MNPRQKLGMPLVSMLDMFFGTFGAMVVVAMMLTFLRLDHGGIDEDSLHLVIVDVATVTDEPPVATDEPPVVNFSKVYVDFDLFSGGQRHHFSPLDPPASEPAYHALARPNGTAAALLLPADRVSDGDMQLTANLRNTSFLVDLSGPERKRERIRIGVALHTRSVGCAVERDLTLGELLEDSGAPSIFSLVVSPDGRLCEEGRRGWEVDNGGRLHFGPAE